MLSSYLYAATGTARFQHVFENDSSMRRLRHLLRSLVVPAAEPRLFVYTEENVTVTKPYH